MKKTPITMLKDDRKEPKLIILDISIIVTIFLCLIFSVGLIKELSYIREYGPDLYRFESAYSNEDFNSIYRLSINYPAISEKKDYKEYYALAMYYGESMLYHALLQNGSETAIKKQEERLSSLEKDMGTLLPAKDKIDAFFKESLDSDND